MGNQHQSSTEAERNRTRHQPSTIDGGVNDENPNLGMTFSPATIVRLQRTIGNTAVQRLLTPDASAISQHPRQQYASAAPVIQREVLYDVRPESSDFWVNMRSRVFTRYVSWIGDARAKLTQFLDVMDDTDPSSAWVGAFKSWLGVFGTPGDITNAVIDTLGALSAGMDEKSTLEQFGKQVHQKLDALSDKVNNLKSDMPIYVALSQKEQEEKSRFTNENDKLSFRLKARSELEQALGLLPNAAGLYQELTIKWTLAGNRWFDDASAFIHYYTSYTIKGSADQGFTFNEVSPGTPDLRKVQQPRNTVRALRNAFGESYPVHKLPVRMEIRFFERGEGPVGSFVKKQHAWVPKEGLGTEKLSDLMGEWLKNGKKPTLGELST